MLIYLISVLSYTQEHFTYITVASIMEGGNWAVLRENLWQSDAEPEKGGGAVWAGFELTENAFFSYSTVIRHPDRSDPTHMLPPVLPQKSDIIKQK